MKYTAKILAIMGSVNHKGSEMLKKILTIIILFAASLSTGFAGSFYLGPALTYADIRSSDLTYQALMPGIYGGYGAWRNEWLYLGLEVFATSKSILTEDSDNDNTILRVSHSYGISVVPMVNLDEVIFGLLRVGYLRTKFPKLDTIQGGYQLGIGVEGILTGCWNLRGEVDYVKYGSIKNEDSDVHVGSVHAVEYTLALIYRFDSLI